MKFITPFSLIVITVSLFIGCGSTSKSNQSQDVSVYSIAPVLRAVVKDANGQLGIQKDMSKNIYTFEEPIVWPIAALSDGKESYVDIDFDGQKSASDIEFDAKLYSNSYAVTQLTTMLMSASDIDTQTLDYNLTRYNSALNSMRRHFALEEEYIKNATPLTSSSKRLAILSDAISEAKHQSDFNASDFSSVDSYFNATETFYNKFLNSKNAIDAAKYHEELLALKLLDSKVLNRIYNNDIPIISARLNSDYEEELRNISTSSFLSSEYNELGNLAYWDIALDVNHSISYVASGNDGFDVVDIAAPAERLGNYAQSFSGFGTKINYFDKNQSRCIMVASQENELLFYGAAADTPTVITERGSFTSDIVGAKAYDVEYMSTNAQNVELLLVADGVAGLKVIDAKTIDCNSSVDLNSSNIIESTQIGIDTHGVVVSSNRKIVYIADGSSGVKSIDISGATPQLLNTITLQKGLSAYDIHLAPNSSELYVSTDSGIEIFSSDDTGALSYQGHYLTEGSRSNLLGETVKVDRSLNAKALFVADISGGLKVLDVSESSNVKLCGTAYFGVGDVAQRSAVRDIKLDERANGEKRLYVANDANGLIVIDDVTVLLFEHCKGLLD